VKLEPLPLSLSPLSVRAALPALRDCLSDQRAVLPVSPDEAGQRLAQIMGAEGSVYSHYSDYSDQADHPGTPETPGTLVACTSGSTGTPKGARLSASALRFSAEATATYFGRRFGCAPGPWLLALPPHHIAGVQVILRSLHAGFEPSVLPPQSHFTSANFATATAALRLSHPNDDLYTSLVPTQLQRLLDDADREPEFADHDGVAALRLYSAILVGGAATSPELVARCESEGIRIVRTYGSSETAGGMVYDGEAIPGTSASIEDTDNSGTGRILLSGPTVADGYRNVDSADAFPEPQVFRTSDIGRIDDGVLSVLGRADGAITSGGLKILPEDVERALASCGFTACVTGVPDPDWGESVAAVIEMKRSTDDLTRHVRDVLRGNGVEAHLIPRHSIGVGALPLTGPGKVDRQAVRQLAATRLDA
jgi:O-succinylbenzoic acid--CoA ligase